MNIKVLLKYILFLSVTASFANDGFIVINSNELNSSVFLNNKFMGLTPLKIVCSAKKSKKLIVESSLSGQKFQRTIPTCSYFANYNADKFINIIFDEEAFDKKKGSVLISENVFQRKKSLPHLSSNRNIASQGGQMSKVENIESIDELGEGYYLQFLSLPFKKDILGTSEGILKKYNKNNTSSRYSYCVKNVLGEDWIRFTLGPFKSVNEAKTFKSGFPKDSFIQFRKGCNS